MPRSDVTAARFWLAALVLFAPMAAVYAAHFLTAPAGETGTGFLQYDQFYYMANAREHYDSGRFTFLYSLPFSPFADSPRLYVQPMSLLLGTVHHFSGLDPGHVYVGFGVLAGVLCMAMAIAVFRELVGLTGAAAWLGLVCFAWGGGVLALAGAAHTLASGAPFLDGLVRYDPGEGYWFLNLGRNVYYSTEAFYHFLTLATTYLLFTRRYAGALGVLAVVSMSHPFTGIQFLTLVGGWALLERVRLARISRQRSLRGDASVRDHGLPRPRSAQAYSIVRRALRPRESASDRAIAVPQQKVGVKCGLGRAGEPPVAFVLGVIALGALHLGYYLGVLNTSEEHRVLQEQWHIDWSLSAPSMLFAYVPVGLLVAWRIRSGARFVETFADPRNRLLGVWFLVSLALANHDLLIDPVQPLHFTRGYVWMPLFLLGAPVLVAALARLLELRLGAALAAAVMLLALSDNMTWLGRFAYDRAVNGKTWGFTLPHEVRDVFALLNRPEYRDALVVSNLPVLGYISTVYTPLRAWWSHGANTPHTDRRRAEVQRFFVRGAAPAEWSTRPLVVLRLVNDNRRWPLLVERLGLVHVFGTRYEVYYRPRLSAPARG